MHMQCKLGISERRACKVLGQSRSVQRHKPFRSLEQEVLREDIVRLASKYGRYGENKDLKYQLNKQKEEGFTLTMVHA